ncbi:MAG: Lrp/AsnC family transcriptional regulator [Mangrovicoccus sp.]
MRIDETDRRLLRQMQVAPELGVNELAERANVTPATARRRLEKLRGAGVLRAVSMAVDWPALGYSVQVSLRISLDKSENNAFDAFLAAAREVPEVLEIQTFLGRVDVRLAVVARDMTHYQELYRSRILTLPHITDIEALMDVAEVKDRTALPL